MFYNDSIYMNDTIIDHKEAEEAEVSGPIGAEASVDPEMLQEMVKAGVFYGRKKSKTNPRMKPYIFTARNAMEIIDLGLTAETLQRATKFLNELFAAKPQARILIVGTEPGAREAVHTLAAAFKFPYVVGRWIGGTLTNFKTITDRINYFKSLKANKASGGLEKYTKKERLMFDRQIERMDRIFSGIESMTELPQALLVFNAKLHDAAVREARLLKIPIVAVVNTDTNPQGIEFPIPANDSAKTSIAWIASYFEKNMGKEKMA